MKINMIIATDLNNVIGRDMEIPWYVPSDLAFFKDITSGHTLLVGRKTHESIVAKLGRPLPNRTSVVVTSKKTGYEHNVIYTDIDNAIDNLLDNEGNSRKRKPFIIGGLSIYLKFLPLVDRIYWTQVMTESDGNIAMPDDWLEGFSKTRVLTPKNVLADEFPYRLSIYERDKDAL